MKRKRIRLFSFDTLNVVLMLILCFVTLYPFWYILVYSFNEGRDAAMGGIWFWPRSFTLMNYRLVLTSAGLIRAFFVTIARSVIGPVYSIVITALAAYAMTERRLPGRKLMLVFYMLPMFIGGTLVSYYLIIVNLRLLNNFWVYIIPGGFSFFNMIIMRSFFEQLPEDIEDSARIDGAGYLTIFFRIVLPLSKPVLAALLFFGLVGHWLDFWTTLIFITKRELYTLQFMLYQIIRVANSSELLKDILATGKMPMTTVEGPRITSQVLKMTALVVVTFPLLFVFPFFQKYFAKGVLLGSVKG